MNNPPIRLAWTDFVRDIQDLLFEKQVDIPMYIVGGAVRDAYLRGAIKDIDVAVDGDAIWIARKFADWFDGDVFVMDTERGVARVFVETIDGPVMLDFARFRAETLEEDLRDRDFTINAMAADLNGDVDVLIDPLGGEDDLKQKILRRCSEHSIKDDPIRALRAVRQSVQLRLRIHPDTLADIRQYASGITRTSLERIRDEFYKVLGSPLPSRAIRVLQHLGILKYVIDDVDVLVDIDQPLPHRFNVWNHTLLVVERMNSILTSISYKRTDNTAATFDMGMLVIQFDRYRARLQARLAHEYGNGRTHQELMILAALIHNLGKVDSVEHHVPKTKTRVASVGQSLRLTNDEQKQLSAMIGAYREVLDRKRWDRLDLHRFWFALGESGVDAILLALADYLGMVGAELEQSQWLAIVERVTVLLDTYFNRYETVVDPPLYLNGKDIMDMLELKSSPVVGNLLTALREAQVTDQITSIEDARGFIRDHYSRQ